MKYYFRLLTLPLFFFALLTSFVVIDLVLPLPSTDELLTIVEIWFRQYGLWILIPSAFLEGILFVGSYFPGSNIIVFSVLLSTTPEQAAIAVFAATCSLVLAHIVNYMLGRYGWHMLLVRLGFRGALQNAEEQIRTMGPAAIVLSYWFPSAAALTDTAAGIARMPLRKFLLFSILASIGWNVFFGIGFYLFKDFFLESARGNSIIGLIMVYGLLLAWMLTLLYFDWRKRTRITVTSS